MIDFTLAYGIINLFVELAPLIFRLLLPAGGACLYKKIEAIS